MPNMIQNASLSHMKFDQLLAATRALLQSGTSPLFKIFTELYFQQLTTADAQLFSAGGLAAAVHALWTLGSRASVAAMPLITATPTGMLPHEAPASTLCIVQGDKPFLIDSIMAMLQQHSVELRHSIHPVLDVTRDGKGEIIAINSDPAQGSAKESWAQFFFSTATPDTYAAIKADAARVLTDVAAAVSDWQPMSRRLQETQVELVKNTANPEPAAFLAWLDAGHFTYLGMRDYKAVKVAAGYSLQLVADSGLGIVRHNDRPLFNSLPDAPLAADIQKFLTEPQPVLVSKTRQVSTVHRAVPMDALFIKLHAVNGDLVGVRLIVGLLTSLAYSRNARDIPLIRQKVTAVVTRSGFSAASHNGKALRHVLDTYPRDELFQTLEDELYGIAIGIVHLRERRRLALFVRRDPFDRYVSCIIYVPREAYDTTVRRRILSELEATFGGSIERYDLALDENPLVRLHVIVNLPQSPVDNREHYFDVAALEDRLVELSRTWSDRLQGALIAQNGESEGLRRFATYDGAFDALYYDSVTPQTALGDIAILEKFEDSNERMAVVLTEQDAHLSFKVYCREQPLDLSETLPTLANLGFHIAGEYGPYQINLSGGTIWLHDYHAAKTVVSQQAIPHAAAIEAAFLAVQSAAIEDDRFNRLTLLAGLPWYEINLLRALAKYLRQIEMPFNVGHIADTLANNPEAARLLVAAFAAKFDPDLTTNDQDARAAKLTAAMDGVMAYIKGVPSLDDDRILSAYAELLHAALRTNYYQLGDDGQPKPYLSIKFASRDIKALPLPKPYAEIFVYSPRVEAVHLRGGKVARGGIRWSDRRDFRTEVLGLMKAQVVKNTVIVPTGSKGGFRLKSLADLPAYKTDPRTAGIAGYTEMMHGLLDLTDNYQGLAVVPPARTVRHDDDDPYLVVAADKGTATFSDIANGISAARGFWLSDAFASGGSVGYDHKAMGITARGAWEAVKRHFRELGVNTQAQDFTVIGVGDMAGDVFGNGMLLSPHIKLVAAFNYAHIFFDPNPDNARAFAERQRLFTLGRGSWDQYDAALLSPGGGIYPRSQKSIPLSPEVQALLGVTADALDPDTLIRAILSAPAELIYFGGIGTYIRAPEESDAQVGDKANDALRIDATQVRARVIGEGANLGITQRGRVALAARGIKLNTDAIDNSAGVDTSDHEVNIKILTADLIEQQQLTFESRNALLPQMTDDVAALVLRDNYLQTQALTLAEAQAVDQLPAQRALLLQLESTGLLNRAVEFLPDEAELARRQAARLGLTRPELAVLMAYVKIWFDQQLVSSSLMTDAILEPELTSYFPSALHARADFIKRHRLARELTTTVVTNEIVNRLGATGTVTMMLETGSSAEQLAAAYLGVRDAFDFPGLWQAIEQLDAIIPTVNQTAMQLGVRQALADSIAAILLQTHGSIANVTALRQQLRSAQEELQQWQQANRDRTSASTNDSGDISLFGLTDISALPSGLVDRLQQLSWLPLLPRLTAIAHESGQPLTGIVPIFATVDARLALQALLLNLQQTKTETPAQARLLQLAAADLQQAEQTITARLVMHTGKLNDAVDDGLNDWLAARAAECATFDALRLQAQSATVSDLALWPLLGRAALQLAQAL